MKNKIRIGIDFDNTIICYDHLFAEAAQNKNWNAPFHLGESKTLIKENLIKLDGNDFRWQELQAIVYGILIEKAQPFEGCTETLLFLKNSNIFELFVVSHKTLRSNYLKEISLVDKAIDWVQKKNLLDFIPKENFFFLPTRDEKIKVINELKLDFFIDDLLEVLEDDKFPAIKKIFFTANPDKSDWTSWRRIHDHFKVIAELGLDELPKIEEFASEPFAQLETIKRDGNNKIFRFNDKNFKNFIIKKYSAINGGHLTLQVEFDALMLLKQHGFPVPTPYLCDSKSNLAIYEQILTSEHSPKVENIIFDFSDFLIKLAQMSRGLEQNVFVAARDSRSKIEDYPQHVSRRLNQIETACSTDNTFYQIQNFIQTKFMPMYEIVLKRYQENLTKFNLNESSTLPKDQTILSPSDFGLHNSVWSSEGKFYFIDFEYFGWDDPVKLVTDFLHHAGQNLELDDRLSIIKKFSEVAQLNQDFFKRLTTVIDLVGLEWILIILNVANPEVLKRRLYANPELNVLELLEQRLTKAQERIDLFHTNIRANSVFLSLNSAHSNVTGIPAWQQLITLN